jgi:predicted acylesterase/phospholipase RssA
MPKRLAITIAGAVSLGSYEAGVLYEVLDAIQQHNGNPRTTADNQIKIDVLTGASAGGMTAVILAQKLLFGANEFVGPYENPLYNVWVKRIDLSGLEATQPDERALDSLFSSDLIEEISREMLMARYANNPVPAPVAHAAAAGLIRLGVAITNLNGVDYGYPVEPGGQFVYTRYVDQMTRKIDASSDNQPFWEPLRNAAVACGAFPIAFRPKDMQRSRAGEPDDYPPANLLDWPQDPATFTYSDGGILQNQPLGMAKNLVDMIDNHNDQESRFYLFVSPHAKDGSENDSFRSANADYAHLVARLASVVMGQAGFQDWITANGVNGRIRLLDERATGLVTALQGTAQSKALSATALQTTAGALLALLFPGGQHTPSGATGPESLDDARNRISLQYAAEIAILGAGSPRARAFRDGILAFESAADLGARDMMRIYGITATSAQLAGAGLQAFLGFFDQELRDHDYDVGRAHARAVLSDPVVAKPGELGPILFDSQRSDIRPIDTRLDGIKLAALPVADQKEFKSGMKTRVNQMLDELSPNRILADAAKIAVDPMLNVALDWVSHQS